MTFADTWGPPLWNYIHTLCRLGGDDKLKQKDKDHLYHCIRSILDVIPCKYCAAEYHKWLDILGRERETRERYGDDPDYLFLWSVDLHNSVNLGLGKPLYK